jgi:hypothetical protein
MVSWISGEKNIESLGEIVPGDETVEFDSRRKSSGEYM